MSILNVNTIQPVGSGQTITVSAANISASSTVVTASSFVGNVTGTVNSTGVITATSFSGSGSGLTGIVNSGITTVAAGTAAAPSISPTGDSNTGIFFPSADTVAIAEGGVEALRVDSSGRVGIGTDIPGSYDSGGRTLVISENSTLAGMTLRSSNQGAIYFADGLTGNEAYRGRIEYSHSSDSLNFGTAGTGSKLTLTSAGAVQVANGNLVFSTAGTGIDFSATANSSGTMTSELLSDYEEGTWTPNFTNVSYTPTVQFGRYTKIGRYVYCTITIDGTSLSGSGTIGLEGLPFTAAEAGDNYQRTAWHPANGGHMVGLSINDARFRINGSTMDGVKGATGSTTYMTGSQLTSGTFQFTGDFSYYTS